MCCGVLRFERKADKWRKTCLMLMGSGNISRASGLYTGWDILPSDYVTRGECLFISENRHYGVIEKYIIHLFKKSRDVIGINHFLLLYNSPANKAWIGKWFFPGTGVFIMPICLFQFLISSFHHPFVRPPEYCPSSKHYMHLNIVYNIQFIIGIDPDFTPSIIPLHCPIYCVFWSQKLAAYYATAFHLQLPTATSYAIPTWCANHYCPSRPFLN